MKLIEEVATARRIKFLVHFTRVENLVGILNYGLLPQTEFCNLPYTPTINDTQRLDYCQNAISLSITFPNYRMFYRYRSEQPLINWVVLAIRPNVLWEKDCAFCVENAAKSSVSTVPIANRRGASAFEKMFAEYPDKPLRTKMGLSNSLPTNPQAEVLVFEKIEPSMIIGAVLARKEFAENFKPAFPNHKFIANRHFFDARPDYQHWR